MIEFKINGSLPVPEVVFFHPDGLAGRGYIHDNKLHWDQLEYDIRDGRGRDGLLQEVEDKIMGNNRATRSCALEHAARNPEYAGRVVQYEGHRYLIVGNLSSMHHKLEVQGDHIALFNIKSRTIRAVRGEAGVTLEINAVVSDYFEDVVFPSERPAPKMKAPRMSQRLMDPKEIELRTNPEYARQLNAVQVEINEYLNNQQREISHLGNEWVPGRVVTVDLQLDRAVVEYLYDKGFRCFPVNETQPNTVFYPPTVEVEVGTCIRW